MRICGAYVRVSSRSQSVETQRVTIAQASKNRGDAIAQWWEETESGKKLDRPQLGAVRAAAKAGELQALYVYKLDRLTRTGIRDTLSLLEEFEGYGVQLVSIADPFDLTSPFAPVIVSVLAWAAEQERRVIGERIADARKRVEAKGGNWGRPRGAIPDATLKRALALVDGGRSVRSVAIQLGVCRTTLFRSLDRLRGVQKPPTETRPLTPGNHIPRKCRP